MGFKITIKSKPTPQQWTAAAAKVRHAVFDVFSVFAIDIVNRVKPQIHIKGGWLSRSVFARADFEGNEPILQAGMGVSEDGRVLRYAWQYEKGGEIVARNVKYLTIPTGALATPSGVEGITADMARTMFKWTWVDPVSGTDPRLFIWGRNPGEPRTALFRLVERVFQPGHHVFFPTIMFELPRIRRGIRLACRNAILGRSTLAVREPGE